MRGVTWVKISEVTSGEWGMGGKPVTTEAVKELAAGLKRRVTRHRPGIPERKQPRQRCQLRKHAEPPRSHRHGPDRNDRWSSR